MVIRNFLFHRVSEEKDAMWPPMKPALFEAIIRYLVKNFDVVSLEQYLNAPGQFPGNKKMATVLFDDGYKDNIEYAAPILRNHNCPASFYIVTDCINRNIPTWTYAIDHIFQQTKVANLELDLDFVPVEFRKVILKANESQSAASRAIKPWMKKLSNSQRLKVMDRILAQCYDVPSATGKMMNWNDIRQLKSENFTIGSHSHTHPMLASLENEKEIVDELNQSYKIIKEQVGAPLTISYPIGSFDERVTGLSAMAGYRYGLAVKQQFFDTNKHSIWEIPRVELYQEPWWKVQLRISGVYSRIKKVWN